MFFNLYFCYVQFCLVLQCTVLLCSITFAMLLLMITRHSHSFITALSTSPLLLFFISLSGTDLGGLFKDFLTDLSARVFDPSYGLFLVTSDNLLYPNPSAILLYPEPGELEALYSFLGNYEINNSHHPRIDFSLEASFLFLPTIMFSYLIHNSNPMEQI